MNSIKFENLYKEDLFNSIKKAFLLRDYRFKNDEDPQLNAGDLNNNTITYYKEVVLDTFIDEFSSEVYETDDIEITEDFEIDYLLPLIEKMPLEFMKGFNKYRKEKGIYDTDGLSNLSKECIKKLEFYSDEIKKSSHLKENIKFLSQKSIDEIYLFLTDKYLSSFTISEKIPLKLNKNQILTLFHLFYENNLIAGIHKNNLYRLIENFFQYYNSTDKEYKNIQGLIKLADELVSKNATKSPQKSLEELKNIFTSKDFFSLKDQ